MLHTQCPPLVVTHSLTIAGASTDGSHTGRVVGLSVACRDHRGGPAGFRHKSVLSPGNVLGIWKHGVTLCSGTAKKRRVGEGGRTSVPAFFCSIWNQSHNLSWKIGLYRYWLDVLMFFSRLRISQRPVVITLPPPPCLCSYDYGHA